MNLVWFKRDLRINDHQPLSEAARADCLAVYIIEEQWLADPHTGHFHQVFLKECLRELARDLTQLGIPLLTLKGDIESNYGNWAYVAGVGVDPRDRIFNIIKQASMYDPEQAYQKRWLN